MVTVAARSNHPLGKPVLHILLGGGAQSFWFVTILSVLCLHEWEKLYYGFNMTWKISRVQEKFWPCPFCWLLSASCWNNSLFQIVKKFYLCVCVHTLLIFVRPQLVQQSGECYVCSFVRFLHFKYMKVNLPTLLIQYHQKAHIDTISASSLGTVVVCSV